MINAIWRSFAKWLEVSRKFLSSILHTKYTSHDVIEQNRISLKGEESRYDFIPSSSFI